MLQPGTFDFPVRGIVSMLGLVSIAICLSLPTAAKATLKTFILDLNAFAREEGLPECNADTLFVTAESSGVTYLSDDDLYHRDEPHFFGQHAGPWYLMNAVLLSNLYTSDINQADLVFVYDYCYWMRGLASVHSGHSASEPSTTLLKLTERVFKLPRWQLHGGADFVFYQPHPGFSWEHEAALCSQAHASIHIVIERGQRYGCPNYNEQLANRTLIVPYSAGGIALQRAKRKPTLLFFKGRCNYTQARHSFGLKMRQEILSTWMSEAGVDISCTDSGRTDAQAESHDTLITRLSHSQFCPVLPGDSQSSRRITDIVLAGCIPVWIGPPWHTVPLAGQLDYSKFALFIHIKHQTYMDSVPIDALEVPSKQRHKTDPRWWTLDYKTEALTYVDTAADIPSYLRSLPHDQLGALTKDLYKVQTRFSWKLKRARVLDAPQTTLEALNALL
jgi:hypothetical protein